MKTNTVRKELVSVIPFPGTTTLTDRQVDNRISKLKALKAQIEELDATRKAIEAEVIQALDGKDSRKTEKYIVTNRREFRHLLDRKRLDADYPGLYEQYKTRISECTKFGYKAL